MEHEAVMRQVEQLAEGFAACSEILTAIGDETGQHLILEMIKIGNCNGVRVGEITEKTNLSRPAVSHHLKIMKDAGLVKVRREGRTIIILTHRQKRLNSWPKPCGLRRKFPKPCRTGAERASEFFASLVRLPKKPLIFSYYGPAVKKQFSEVNL